MHRPWKSPQQGRQVSSCCGFRNCVFYRGPACRASFFVRFVVVLWFRHAPVAHADFFPGRTVAFSGLLFRVGGRWRSRPRSVLANSRRSSFPTNRHCGPSGSAAGKLKEVFGIRARLSRMRCPNVDSCECDLVSIRSNECEDQQCKRRHIRHCDLSRADLARHRDCHSACQRERWATPDGNRGTHVQIRWSGSDSQACLNG